MCSQPELAARDGGPGGGEPGVEAARIADLHRHAAARDPAGTSAVGRMVRATGFSQNTGTPGSTAASDELRVGVGGRGDHHAVDAGGQQLSGESAASTPNRSPPAG